MMTPDVALEIKRAGMLLNKASIALGPGRYLCPVRGQLARKILNAYVDVIQLEADHREGGRLPTVRPVRNEPLKMAP